MGRLNTLADAYANWIEDQLRKDKKMQDPAFAEKIGKGQLRLYSTGNTSTLADMWVECTCGAKRSMSGATQKDNFEGQHCPGLHPFRPRSKREKCDREVIF